MESNRIKIKKYTGVYYREHATRKWKGKPDKCFEINYRYNGLLRFEKVGYLSEGYTAEAANQIRSERIRNLRHGELPQKQIHNYTLNEVWEKYNQWAESNRKSFEPEQCRYTKHIKPALGKFCMQEITPFVVEQFKDKLNSSNFSAQSIKHVLVLIRTIFNKALLWQLYDGENPIMHVKIPKPNNKRERFFAPEEIALLLQEIEKSSPMWKDLTILSLLTGMRAGEIFNLKWKDIDFDNQIIYLENPKSGQAQHVFMTEITKQVFVNAYEKLPGYNAPEPEQYVFLSRNGGKIEEVSDTFKRTIDKLELNKGITDRRQLLTFHSLRHTFASYLALDGTYLPVLQSLMRHSKPDMSLRYTHLIPDSKRKAVQNVENRLKDALKNSSNGKSNPE